MSEDGEERRKALWPVRPPGAARVPPASPTPAEPPAPSATQPPPAPPRRTPPAFERLAAFARSPLLAVALFLLVNALLLTGYLWSRGGQTVEVRLEARGNMFVATVDGAQQIAAELEAPAEGGIFLTLDTTENIPSIPSPRGIDHVRVIDLDTGDVLFEDDFSDGPEGWTEVAPSLVTDSGVVGASGVSGFDLTGQPWRDYAVEVELRNALGLAILVRAQDRSSGLEYGLRPFRHYDQGFSVFEDGQIVRGVGGPPLQLERGDSVRTLFAMILEPYPLLIAALAAGLVVVAAAQFAGRRVSLPPAPGDLPWLAVGSIAAAAFGVTLFLNYSYGSHMPHVPDEVAYVFQAKIFAGGRLAGDPPPVEAVFDYFYPPFFIVTDGEWSSVYTFGHSAVLAIGTLVGAVWLVPPLLGAGSVLLLFTLGRKVYSTRVGLLAAALLASSPFFLMTASNFMSHNTAAFLLLASLVCIVSGERRPLVFGVLGGLLFGLLFNTRPLETVALMPAFALFLLVRLIPQDTRTTAFRQLVAFGAGGAVMLGLYLLYNLGTTGDALTSNLTVGNEEEKLLGFGGPHSLSLGVQNQEVQMAFLVLVLHGWPLYVGLAFVLLPFVLGTRNAWDWFVAFVAVSVMVVYFFFIGHGVMHGPRYWYPAAPLLLLLAARGAERAAGVLAGGAAELRLRLTGAADPPVWASGTLAYALVLALIGASLYGWLFGQRIAWQDAFVPPRAVALRSFNNADDRLIELIERADLDNALVLVENCPGWQCYGSVFWMNDPGLDGDIVFARDLPERRGELFARYPDRRVYQASYTGPSLVVFGGTPSVIGPLTPDGAADAPRAGDLPVPTPVPVPTPDPQEAARRDEQRIADLAAMAAALEEYRDRNGSYPATRGLQSFCRYADLDAGCAVLEVLDPLPRDPLNDGDYHLISDGREYVIFALMEAPPDQSGCPDPVPFLAEQADLVYCQPGGG